MPEDGLRELQIDSRGRTVALARAKIRAYLEAPPSPGPRRLPGAAATTRAVSTCSPVAYVGPASVWGHEPSVCCGCSEPGQALGEHLGERLRHREGPPAVDFGAVNMGGPCAWSQPRPRSWDRPRMSRRLRRQPATSDQRGPGSLRSQIIGRYSRAVGVCNCRQPGAGPRFREPVEVIVVLHPAGGAADRIGTRSAKDQHDEVPTGVGTARGAASQSRRSRTRPCTSRGGDPTDPPLFEGRNDVDRSMIRDAAPSVASSASTPTIVEEPRAG